MLRSRIRLLWLLVAAPFVATSAVPVLPHHCEMGAGDAAAAPAAAGHHHGTGDSAPRPGPSCQCFGHACCAGRFYLPTQLPGSITTLAPIRVPAVSRPVTPALARPHYLLPVALAPPALA